MSDASHASHASHASPASHASHVSGSPGAPHTYGTYGSYSSHGTLTPLARPHTRISPGHTPTHGSTHTPTPAKLLAGVAWAVLLLGLWLWGRDVAEGVAAQLATTGDVAAVGRPLGRQTPPHAHTPVPTAGTARPVGITIGALGVREAGITERGLDEHGILTPPPDNSPAPVGWYAAGPQPGEAGAALLVGRAGTGRDPRLQGSVVHRLAGIKPGSGWTSSAPTAVPHASPSRTSSSTTVTASTRGRPTPPATGAAPNSG